MTNGFLAPMFFISVGLHLEISALIVIPGFVLAARCFGFSRYDAAVIGVAMNARGAVELVIADIAFHAGVFDYPSPRPPIVEHLFSAVVIRAIATTLITSPLLRFIFLRGESGHDS